MAFYDPMLAAGFLASLAVMYIIIPLTLSYYLVRRKFMSDRLRYAFGGVLLFDVLFIVFLVVMDIIA
jgi:hypothetical protein